MPPSTGSGAAQAPAPRGPTVAVTGATGFIGQRLVSQLLAAGWSVRALYRPRAGRTVTSTPTLHWIAGDLNDPAALADLVAGAGAFIHCAGAVRGRTQADFDRVNVLGVQHVVRAAVATPGCRRFLLLSSLAARAPELSHYGGSKRRGEQALAADAGNLAWTILRPPAVYGPGDREMRALFRNMARGWAPVPGTGRSRFSLIYVDDLAAAIVAWLQSGHDARQTYELDDGHAGGYDWPAALDVASQALRGGQPVRALHVPVALLRAAGAMNALAARLLGYAPMLTPGKVREITHANWVCDPRAFQEATGWRAAVPFAQGLVRTLAAAPTDQASHG